MASWSPEEQSGGPADGVMDTWLLGILAKERNRQMLARLEDTLTSFVKDDSTQRLEFPPKSAFQRKIFHRVALYYGLDHKILEVDGANGGSGMRSLVLIKTSASAAPKTRLCDMDLEVARRKVSTSLDGERPDGTERGAASSSSGSRPNVSGDGAKGSNGKPAVFLRRPRSDSSLYKGWGGRSNSGGSKLKSVSEAEYEQARARIFKNNETSACPSSERPPRSTRGPEVTVKLAAGPVEGTSGFAGRGRGAKHTTTTNMTPSLPSGLTGTSIASTPRKKGGLDKAKPTRPRSAGVKDGNLAGDSDKHDPDFDRRYSRWAGPQAPIQPPQIVPTNQGAPYFNVQSYAHFSFQPHLPHHGQQHTSAHHLHDQAFPGMMTGRGDGELIISHGGWNSQARATINQAGVPTFNLETMSDFPSLSQAHSTSRKGNPQG